MGCYQNRLAGAFRPTVLVGDDPGARVRLQLLGAHGLPVARPVAAAAPHAITNPVTVVVR